MDKKDTPTTPPPQGWLKHRVPKTGETVLLELQAFFLDQEEGRPPFGTRRFGFGQDNVALYGNPFSMYVNSTIHKLGWTTLTDPTKEIRLAPDLLLDDDHKAALVTWWLYLNRLLGEPCWDLHTTGQLLAVWNLGKTVFDDSVFFRDNDLVYFLLGLLHSLKGHAPTNKRHIDSIGQMITVLSTDLAPTMVDMTLTEDRRKWANQSGVLLSLLANQCCLELANWPILEMVDRGLQGPVPLRGWMLAHLDFPPLKSVAQEVLAQLVTRYRQRTEMGAPIARLQIDAAITLCFAETFGLSLNCLTPPHTSTEQTEKRALAHFCATTMKQRQAQGHVLPTPDSPAFQSMMSHLGQQWSQLDAEAKAEFMTQAKNVEQKSTTTECTEALVRHAAEATTCSPVEKMSMVSQFIDSFSTLWKTMQSNLEKVLSTGPRKS